MENRDWEGCFQARPAPYDLTDEEPNSGDPDTLFVPYFAPDEGMGGYNNYMASSASACVGPPVFDPRDAVRNTCKYGLPGDSYRIANTNSFLSHPGPNWMCRTAPMLPLTSNIQAARDAVEAMHNRGAPVTVMEQGLVWGWRVLSPGEPFTEGAAYGSLGLSKILVLMTDGENLLSNGVGGNYAPFGYPGDGQLEETSGQTVTHSSSYATVVDAMNTRMLELCDNIKATGITIYTIGFEVDRDDAEVLVACASQPDLSYFPQTEQELIDAYSGIGQALRTLRITMH